MHRSITCLLFLGVVVGAAIPAVALNTGTDVIVPAAARAGTWVTDLYIMNPGSQTANITVYWLVRDQPNPSPVGQAYTLPPGQTLVLEDLIMDVFGLDDVGGAFRVVSDQDVVVNTRIFNDQSGVTFGQGFEGVPASMAIPAGGSTDIVGLTHNASFRTNVVVIDASGTGCTVQMSLRDTAGAEIASKTYTLGAYEPALEGINRFSGFSNFNQGTLHAEVTNGSAIVVASKVDNDSATGDPTTLEGWSSSCGDVDGTYQVSLYDNSGYATGGNMVIGGGSITAINASYTNWDKGDPLDPDCTLVFLWGSPEAGTHTLTEYGSGVTFAQTFTNSGTMTWTVTLTVADNQAMSGTVDAVGSNFTGEQAGCNGSFPQQQLLGGKAN